VTHQILEFVNIRHETGVLMSSDLLQGKLKAINFTSLAVSCASKSFQAIPGLSVPGGQVRPQDIQDKDQNGMHDGFRIVVFHEAEQSP
jgi:hypothetical protein